ncbi:hypothetical protein BC831DRAFT_483677 [Entophlyctis helioformis]|nr:hypothetical protein BC831DRAFT_483677 [Entophlyctis helioformis]
MTVEGNSKYFRTALGFLTPNNLNQAKAVHNAACGGKVPLADDATLKKTLALESVTRMGYFNDIPAGAVLCQKSDDGSSLRVLALAVLPAYQRYGLGKLMLDNVVKEASAPADKADAMGDKIRTVVATLPAELSESEIEPARLLFAGAGFEADESAEGPGIHLIKRW